MRGGKSISLIALGIFVAWILQPLWQWWLGRALDSASRAPSGVSSLITKAVVMTAPVHPLLLGVSIGMFIALTIGYWGTITNVRRRWAVWASEISALSLVASGNTDPKTGPVKPRILSGDAWLNPDETAKRVQIKAFVDHKFSEIKWWPRDKFYCAITDPTTITITRLDQSGERLKVAYEVCGRVLFWRTIREWRETGRIDEIIRRQAAQRAITSEAPSRRLPPSTGSETPP